MTTQVQLTTADELLRIPDDGFRYELIKGELKKMAPAGNEHGMLALEFAAELRNFVKANKLGRSTPPKRASNLQPILIPSAHPTPLSSVRSVSMR